MSMMEALIGHTPGADILLRLLQLAPKDCGRLRDVFLNKDLQIVVFTRNGGGNRPDFEDVTRQLRRHPLFAGDYDDSLDNTYAYYVFNPPIDAVGTQITRKQLQQFRDRTSGDIGEPMERFNRILEKMRNPKTPSNDPELVHARELGKRIMKPIMDAMSADSDSDSPSIISVNADGTVDVQKV